MLCKHCHSIVFGSRLWKPSFDIPTSLHGPKKHILDSLEQQKLQMIPDIKIARAWFTGTQDSLVWSDEGVIASPSRDSINLFVSFTFCSLLI